MTPYYSHGGIEIYHGNCLDVMPSLTIGCFDLAVTSPPYNLGNTSGGGFPGKRQPFTKPGGRGKWAAAAKCGALAHGYGEHDDNMPHAEYVAWQKRVLTETWQLIKPTGAVFYNHKPRIFDGLCVTPLEYIPDLPLRQIVIWRRAGGINFSPAFYLPTHEWIVILAKPDFRLRSKGVSGAGDVWEIPQESNTAHPAPFPIDLPLRAIETTGARDILDPFAGSGTTLVAAKRLNRRAVGIEINERFCEMAARRLSQEVLDFGEVA